ncbi:MAG TPA: iron-sulfur cluster assembly accessory protein [Alphaproteobacteria bacterium]|nr:iron-sulfur cluster assembly accessory protein [Alphaproteobacteria bacterium]
MSDPVTLTTRAAEAIKARVRAAPPGTVGVRLSVRSTGCSGNSYRMDFVGEKDDTAADDRFEHEGAVLFISTMESWMLFGTVVDYAEDYLGNTRFTFTNPNETGRCGCGESFQVGSKREKT